MKTFPVMLKLEGIQTVVVGCGKVGLRKVSSLSNAGAKIRLISGQAETPPNMPPYVEIITADYDPKHLQGAKLVFACTNNRTVNAKISADAREIGAMVNAADQPDDCDFFMPATLHDGDVTVAIGTGGVAPALAGELKKQLLTGGILPERIGQFAALLAEVRCELNATEQPQDTRTAMLRRLAGQDAYQTFISAGEQGLRDYMLKIQKDLKGQIS